MVNMLTNRVLVNKFEQKSCKQEKNMTTHETPTVRHFVQPDWREFVCGCGAAVINITITYPINKLIFRQMLTGVRVNNAFTQLYNEGLHFLYRGMLPPLIQKSLSLSVMFGVYEEVKRPLLHMQVNTYAAKVLGGLAAGSMEAIFTPLERIQTLLADSKYHHNFRNTFHAFKVVGLQYGLKEYYRGAHTILLRNGPANACFFIVRDELQRSMPKTDSDILRTLMQFIFGASIGACISCLYYPLNVAKVAMQSQIGGKFDNIFNVLPRVYRQRGSKLRYVYRGVHANCTRSFFSWGVMNAAYENLKTIIYS